MVEGPQGDDGPFPNALPAVLLRISPPNGRLLFGSSARSSGPSFVSVNFRLKKGDDSSLGNRPVPDGEAMPLIESLVCCRRVPGRLEAGEANPAYPPWPCEIDVFRPFAPSVLESLGF